MASDANEVAEDYRHALEDLSSNTRFEISNLTVIARENTEHALTIAEVLQQHILKAPPSKKLPSLYVLDSIVKNVGTPYTLFFGRNLFKIFMESYAVVDNQMRRKMEEMLRTWKDPVPGSLDMRPVFSHELLRPIENALMRVRAASMPQQQQQSMLPGRPRPGMQPIRDTPTPPNMRGPAGYPGPQQQQYPPQGQPIDQASFAGQQQFSRPSPQSFGSAPGPFQPPTQYPYGQPVGTNVEQLNADIYNLIMATQAESSRNPHDTSIQGRLRALQDLQGVLQHSSLPPDQLELIKNKVAELASVTLRLAQPPPPQIPSVTPTPPPAVNAAAAHPSVTLDALLGQGALAALLAKTVGGSQSSTPTLPAGALAVRSPPPPAHIEPIRPVVPLAGPAAPPPGDTMALLAKLRQAGMIAPTVPTAPVPAPAPTIGNGHVATPPPVAPPSIFSANLANILSKARAQAEVASSTAALGVNGLNSAILKQQFRPDIIGRLHDNLGPPCTQCGRRFRTDEIGRQKKMAHMDWHFKVHQRSAEAEKRGMHRSWYVDQQDWIKSREIVDADHQATQEETATEAAKVPVGPKYIPVPDPSSGINTVCPICQERFENKWLDTAQEWVWLDAVLVRNRAFHASCLAEASKDRDGTPRRSPDPILGKRKAEAVLSSPKVRSVRMG